MSHSSGYRDRVAKRLRALVDSHGASINSIERRLKRRRGYVADALRGDKKLSVETILEVLEVLGVPPEQFFERPWRGGSLSDLSGPALGSGTLPDSLRDASPTLQAIVLLLAGRGLLSLEEVNEMQRELALPPAAKPTAR